MTLGNWTWVQNPETKGRAFVEARGCFEALNLCVTLSPGHGLSFFSLGDTCAGNVTASGITQRQIDLWVCLS